MTGSPYTPGRFSHSDDDKEYTCPDCGSADLRRREGGERVRIGEVGEDVVCNVCNHTCAFDDLVIDDFRSAASKRSADDRDHGSAVWEGHRERILAEHGGGER